MSKKYFVLTLAMIVSITSASAVSFYQDDLSRTHFMPASGVGGAQHFKMTEAQTGAVNDAMQEYAKEKAKDDATVPAATIKPAKKNDTPYSYGNVYVPANVNDSKTIYTDDLGRLHFFGKDNIIKE